MNQRRSILSPIAALIASESASAVVLLIMAITAVVWANSPWHESYVHLFHVPIEVDLRRLTLKTSPELIINDALMVLFFLMVGLEIKRELIFGELNSWRTAALPVFAAIGGMIVPASLFAICNLGKPGINGWAIPMATDIAFAVGVLSLACTRVPTSLKIFLLAVAIVDDLGAVLVIAVFYTKHLSLPAVTMAVAAIIILVGMNRLRVRRLLPYLVVGTGLWLAILASGIHATVAGVLLAMTIPATRGDDVTSSPLARLEHALLRPVNWIIVPLFALANAGVAISADSIGVMHDPIFVGVVLGLLVGKPSGVLTACWLAVRFNIATLPTGVKWRAMLGVATLCGIGFTMSLFITSLAFGENQQHALAAKCAILLSSAVCGVVGALLVSRTGSPSRAVDVQH